MVPGGAGAVQNGLRFDLAHSRCGRILDVRSDAAILQSHQNDQIAVPERLAAYRRIEPSPW